MQYGYSFYLNHFNDETKDIIQGTTIGAQREWLWHNWAYYGLSIATPITEWLGWNGLSATLEELSSAAKNVDLGFNVFASNPPPIGLIMQILNFLTIPVHTLIDLMLYLAKYEG